MEWLRWYHGAASDDKWPLIARRSGQSVAVVVAVWASLLECASADDEDRGSIRSFDPESIDALLQIEEGATQAIVDALSGGKKPRIAGGRIVNWEKRQPRREREDSKSTERVRQYRERQKALQDKQDGAGNANETPVKHHETPRSDKIREELKTEEGGDRARAHVASAVPENTPPPPRERPKKTDCPSKGDPDWPVFQSCFSIFPVQQDKEGAWREWMRLKKNGTLAPSYVIRDAIIRLSAEDSRWLRGKVPNMAKWLARKGWEDEPYIEPAATSTISVRDGPPVARTQFQKGRQDMEGMAGFVLAADRELTKNGNNSAHHHGIGTNGPALQAANEP